MNITEHPVVASLAPVVLLIGLGYLAGRREWLRSSAVKDLSNLVFMLLIPALLFRTMSGVHIELIDTQPVLAYFLAALLLLGGAIFWRGFSRRSVVLALASVFSNMVMIGITLVQLAYGKQGLVTLLTLVSVHAIIVLTVATIALELAVAKEDQVHGVASPHVLSTSWAAFKNALIHPVPLPIVCGLAFAQTGWTIPGVVDKPLMLLGSAFGPISLLLVGVTMAHTPLRGHVSSALWVACSKNLLLPLMVGVCAWVFGVTGLPLTVLVVTAALPTGANAYLFAQRYEVGVDVTTASMALSNVLALFTVSGVMLAMNWLV